MPKAKTSKRKLSLAAEEVPSAHYLSTIWQHLTESLCEEVFAATRERERQRKWTPYVLGPSAVPEVTDVARAQEDPELAVLSAMAHGRDADSQKSAQIAVAAQIASAALEEDRSKLYFDLIMNSLSEAARQALRTMDLSTYEYQSDFAKHYVAQGVAEGEIRGRAALVMRQLTARFGAVSADARSQILALSSAELDLVGERLLTARTLEEAFGLG